MRIAVSASGSTLDSNVDPRFGRCPFFVIADTESGDSEAVENASVAASQGAGISTAQMMAEKQVGAVLTGNCGPNAYQALNAAGIDIITGVSGSVRDAIESFKAGRYRSSTAPNVSAHHGLGGGAGRGMQSGMGTSATEDNSSGMMQVLQELKIQLDGLRSQVEDINSRIDQLHKND